MKPFSTRPRVLKFGGTSVDGATRIAAVAEIVSRARVRGPVVVVTSAFAGVTDELDRLLALALVGGDTNDRLLALRRRHLAAAATLATSGIEFHRVRGEVLRRTAELAGDLASAQALVGVRPRPATSALRARVLAVGERLSAPVVVAALAARGLAAEVVDGVEVLVTRGPLNAAEVDFERTRALAVARLASLLAGERSIPVVTGFLGASAEGATAVLGRGGSDLSATALGAALAAEAVEIWTDVDGVHAVDPRLVPEGRPIPRLSYGDAESLARAGARVLFAPAIPVAAAAAVPIRVADSFRPEREGTWIPAPPGGEIVEPPAASP